MDAAILDFVWRGALAIIPVALVVALVCRCLPARPSTRHSLWLLVLVLLAAAPILAQWTAAAETLNSFARATLLADSTSTLQEQPITPRPPATPEHETRAPAVTAPTPMDPAPAPSAAAPASGRSWTAPSRPMRIAPLVEHRAAPSRPGVDRSRPRVTTTAPARGDWQSPFRWMLQDDQPVVPSPMPRVDDYLAGTQARVTELALPGGEVDATPTPMRALARGGAMPASSLAAGAEPARVEVDAEPVAPVDPSDRAVIGPGESARSASVVRDWGVQLATIRDAAMNLPPIPLGVWMGGLGLIALVLGVRVFRSARVLRRGEPAPADVEAMVREIAASLALRRVPRTLMIDGRFSPMIWCGREAVMVLPSALWGQLDEAGRRAVIVHELAHLRRRDHWVSWGGLLIGSVYWWHPVAWWVRRRLQEEADLCCDAWVTCLLPTSRRAYAQALLDTRRFTSEPGTFVPAVGLGATTARTKRFARRLTMVMTEQSAPRSSRRGMALVWTLALAGVIATPLLACPPEKKDKPKAPAPTAKLRIAAPKPPKPPKPPTPPKAPQPPKAPAIWSPTTAPAPADTTFEQYLRDRDRGNTSEMSLEERLERLERQLDRLHEALEKLHRETPGAAPRFRGMTAPRIEAVPLPSGAAAPLAVPRVRGTGAAIATGCECVCRGGTGSCCTIATGGKGAASAPSVPGMTGGGYAYVAPGAVSFTAPALAYGSAVAAAGSADETVAKTYELPRGKLEGLTKLMVRSDVPILVSPGETSIEVHATHKQHMIFEAFCLMINGQDRVQEYRLSEGKLRDLTELMARSDVPILIERGSTAITVHGTDLEQAIFRAFVEMIHPSKESKSRTDAAAAADAARRSIEEVADAYETRADQARAQQRSMEVWRRELENQVRQLERQIERLHRQADRAEAKGEECASEADELLAKAEEAGSDREIERARARAAQMLQRAESCYHEARALASQADALESQLHALEDQARQVEEQMERYGALSDEHDDADWDDDDSSDDDDADDDSEDDDDDESSDDDDGCDDD